jgi:hypothetical protein
MAEKRAYKLAFLPPRPHGLRPCGLSTCALTQENRLEIKTKNQGNLDFFQPFITNYNNLI